MNIVLENLKNIEYLPEKCTKIYAKARKGILSQLNKNAPDYVPEHFQNFPLGGGACPRTPLVVRALGAHLGRYAPKLSAPASLSSTSTFFEKENPAQCEADQGNPMLLGMFYWLRIKLYIGFLVSARGTKKKEIFQSQVQIG